MKQYWYVIDILLLKVHIIQILSLFPFFCSRIPFEVQYDSSHVSLDSSWLWQFHRLSLFLRALAVLRSTSQVFCRKLPNQDLSDAFLMIRLGEYIFGRKTTEVKCILIMSYLGYILLIGLITWCWPSSFGLRRLSGSPQ